MKIAIIYLHVAGKAKDSAYAPAHYLPWSRRFIESHRRFKGETPSDLWVVTCGGPLDSETKAIFPECDHFLEYRGEGWDIGAHQKALRTIEADFALCLNTGAYFSRPGGIESMMAARVLFGDGIYGATASFENHPHLRTTSWACDPATFRDYPMTVDERLKTFEAESGPNSITEWYASQGKPTMLVLPDGNYTMEAWRTPPNIFRRGDQSNTFIRDRHFDWFDEVNGSLKTIWEDTADGKNR